MLKRTLFSKIPYFFPLILLVLPVSGARADMGMMFGGSICGMSPMGPIPCPGNPTARHDSQLSQRQQWGQSAGQHDLAVADRTVDYTRDRIARDQSIALESLGQAAKHDVPRQKRPADVRPR